MTRMHLPVIIIGAPRSGTNMIRDVLCKLPGFETWPCDEINYIWRHGNVRQSSDEFSSGLATPKVIEFIKREFIKLATKRNALHVVEKTCANSLRVNFVHTIFPEAKYIFIVRDGVDVVASAMKRWRASLDIPYILRKLQYVPMSDLPYYGLQYLWNRVYFILSRQKRLTFWGPSFKDMETIIAKHSLEEICAIQWERCVETAARDFNKIPEEKIHQLRYEDFVQHPTEELEKICSFLNVAIPESDAATILKNVSDKSVGKGHIELKKNGAIEKILPHIKETLDRYGY